MPCDDDRGTVLLSCELHGTYRGRTPTQLEPGTRRRNPGRMAQSWRGREEPPMPHEPSLHCYCYNGAAWPRGLVGGQAGCPSMRSAGLPGQGYPTEKGDRHGTRYFSKPAPSSPALPTLETPRIPKGGEGGETRKSRARQRVACTAASPRQPGCVCFFFFCLFLLPSARDPRRWGCTVSPARARPTPVTLMRCCVAAPSLKKKVYSYSRHTDTQKHRHSDRHTDRQADRRTHRIAHTLYTSATRPRPLTRDSSSPAPKPAGLGTYTCALPRRDTP